MNARHCIFPIAILALSLCATCAYAGEAMGPSVFKGEGDRLLRQGAIDEAICAYKKAVASDSDSTAAWFNLAIACYAKRDLTGAGWALESLLRSDPQDSEAHYNLGCMRLYQGDAHAARLEFERARNCGDVQSYLGEQIAKALNFLDNFEEISPVQRQRLLQLLHDGLEPLRSA